MTSRSTKQTVTVIFTRDCVINGTKVTIDSLFEAVIDEDSDAVEGYRIRSASYKYGYEWDGEDLGFVPLTSDLVAIH